jgi:glycosyltransferase involved in cell wall biosynthesis
LRICYIADGISIHTQRWVGYFARKGHEVHVISNRFPPDCKGYDGNIELHHLTTLFPKLGVIARYLSFPLWVFQVRRLIRKINPNIVDAHFITVYGYLGAFSSFHPLVLTAWGSDILITPKNNPVHKFVTSRALKRADRIICVSPVLKRELLMLDAALEKTHIIPMGIDVQKFTPAAKDLALLQTLGISDSLVTISVRALKPIYNVETLLRAAPQVLREIPNSRFIIAGEGEQRKYLEGLAYALDIAGNVRFVGWITHEELPKYLASSDVYVSTSLSDSLGVSNLEAMACGLPVVVGDLPAIREWITDEANGFIFPLKDHQALAENVVHLLKDESLRRKVGEAGRKVVMERAEYREQMTNVEALYQELISSDI